jgi:hypothetical protein
MDEKDIDISEYQKTVLVGDGTVPPWTEDADTEERPTEIDEEKLRGYQEDLLAVDRTMPLWAEDADTANSFDLPNQEVSAYQGRRCNYPPLSTPRYLVRKYYRKPCCAVEPARCRRFRWTEGCDTDHTDGMAGGCPNCYPTLFKQVANPPQPAAMAVSLATGLLVLATLGAWYLPLHSAAAVSAVLVVTSTIITMGPSMVRSMQNQRASKSCPYHTDRVACLLCTPGGFTSRTPRATNTPKRKHTAPDDGNCRHGCSERACLLCTPADPVSNNPRAADVLRGKLRITSDAPEGHCRHGASELACMLCTLGGSQKRNPAAPATVSDDICAG